MPKDVQKNESGVRSRDQPENDGGSNYFSHRLQDVRKQTPDQGNGESPVYQPRTAANRYAKNNPNQIPTLFDSSCTNLDIQLVNKAMRNSFLDAPESPQMASTTGVEPSIPGSTPISYPYEKVTYPPPPLQVNNSGNRTKHSRRNLRYNQHEYKPGYLKFPISGDDILEELKQQEAMEKHRIMREIRKEFKANNEAAAQERIVEMMRKEESEKIIQAKVERSIDEVMALLKEKIEQEFGTKKHTGTGKDVSQHQVQDEVQPGMEEVGKQKAAARDAQQWPSPLQRGPFEPPTLGPISPSIEESEPSPRLPPPVPEPPNANFETESEKQTTPISSSAHQHRWSEQEISSQEHQENKAIHIIGEGPVFPIADKLEARPDKVTCENIVPIPAPSRQRHFPQPLRASSSDFKSTSRQCSPDLGSSDCKSELGIATETPHRYLQAREQSSRQSTSPGVKLLSPHQNPAEQEKNTPTQNNDIKLGQVEPSLGPTNATTRVERKKSTKAEIIIETAVRLLEDRPSLMLLLLLLLSLLLSFLFLCFYYIVSKLFM
ncbi:hypothetical protein F4805DRAFT_476449 [Annulohypoxylon moriforme]|nr:hypothetical protein F4805DRAFT_476449 [Annulohypoxylon moriforme]